MDFFYIYSISFSWLITSKYFFWILNFSHENLLLVWILSRIIICLRYYLISWCHWIFFLYVFLKFNWLAHNSAGGFYFFIYWNWRMICSWLFFMFCTILLFFLILDRRFCSFEIFICWFIILIFYTITRNVYCFIVKFIFI